MSYRIESEELEWANTPLAGSLLSEFFSFSNNQFLFEKIEDTLEGYFL